MLSRASRSSSLRSAATEYQFDNTAPGSYYIEFVPPEGYGFTQQYVGSDDTIGSDVDPATHRTSNFTLSALDELFNIDAGLVEEVIEG